MKKHIEERVLFVGNVIANSGITVREVASIARVSKSTVHTDATKRLIKLNPHLASIVREKLDSNWKEKHIRGGNSTRLRYKKLERVKVNS